MSGEKPDNVIQMFNRKVEPTEKINDEQALHDLLTPELDSSLLDVQVQITDLLDSETVAEFAERLSAIKTEVAGWPDAHP